MLECWMNVYKWFNNYTNEYTIFVGKDKFPSIFTATAYRPSFGLTVAYRLHVKLKQKNIEDFMKAAKNV